MSSGFFSIHSVPYISAIHESIGRVKRGMYRKRLFRINWVLIALLGSPIHALAAPDEEQLGKSKGYPVGSRSNWFFSEAARVGSFSGLDTIFPHNTLPKSHSPAVLRRAAAEPPFHYTFEGKRYSLDDYLNRQRTTGLLIIKGGEILVERYQYERKPTDRFISNSMAKSLVSLAVGLAVSEGKIRSLDDTVATYAPELTGNSYGETRIRNLLRMASGVRFNESYGRWGDLARFSRLLDYKGSIEALRGYTRRDTAEGQSFNYASVETQALAVAVHGATGETLSSYLGKLLWQPMGAEADATWVTTGDDLEQATGLFSATLRDWGRLGVLLANDGVRDGKQILPKNYLLEATDWHQHPAVFAPKKATPWFGYGYQFWIFPGEQRRFALLGVYGQAIYVDPALKLVLVHTAVARNADSGQESMGPELGALWYGLVSKYGRW